MGRVGFPLLLFFGAFAVLAASADKSLPGDKKIGGEYLETFKEKLNKLIQKEKAKGKKPEEAKEDNKVVANDDQDSKALASDLSALLSDLLSGPTMTKPSTDKAAAAETTKEENKTPPKQDQQQPEYRWPPAPVEPVEDKQAAKSEGKKAEMADDDDSVELVIQSGHKLCAELNMTAVHALVDAGAPSGKAKLPSGGDDKAAAAKSDHHPAVMEHLMILTGTPSNCIMEEKEVGELKKVLESVVSGSHGNSPTSSSGDSSTTDDDYEGTPDYDDGAAPPSGGSGAKPYTECMRLLSESRRQLKSKCLRVLGPAEDRQLLRAPAAHQRELKKKHLLRVLAAMDRPSAVDALKQLFGIVPDDVAKPAVDDSEVDSKKPSTTAVPKADGEVAGGKKGDGKAEKGETPFDFINEFLDQQPAEEQQKDVEGSGARPAEKLTKLTDQTEAPKDAAAPKAKKEKEAGKKQQKAGGPVVEKCELFTLRRNKKGLVVDVDPKCAHATDAFDWNGISKLLDSMVLPPPQLPPAA